MQCFLYPTCLCIIDKVWAGENPYDFVVQSGMPMAYIGIPRYARAPVEFVLLVPALCLDIPWPKANYKYAIQLLHHLFWGCVGFVEYSHPLKVEEDEAFHALCVGNSLEILVTHEPSNIRITRKVLQCLRPGAWLNDEVINLYLELLKERERREPGNYLTCHFFNTFFFKKLTSGRNGYDYRAVRRWTAKEKMGYSLSDCDKVFVPIHKDIHWCLVVINVKDETFQYLDSLGGMDIHVLEVLARYIMEESRDKVAKEVDTSSWKRESVDGLPLQINAWDCGMFMLKYIDLYSRGLELSFNQEHIAYFRKAITKQILTLKAE